MVVGILFIIFALAAAYMAVSIFSREKNSMEPNGLLAIVFALISMAFFFFGCRWIFPDGLIW